MPRRENLHEMNVFDKPSAEPSLLGLCRGEKTCMKGTFSISRGRPGFSGPGRKTCPQGKRIFTDSHKNLLIFDKNKLFFENKLLLLSVTPARDTKYPLPCTRNRKHGSRNAPGENMSRTQGPKRETEPADETGTNSTKP